MTSWEKGGIMVNGHSYVVRYTDRPTGTKVIQRTLQLAYRSEWLLLFFPDTVWEHKYVEIPATSVIEFEEVQNG